MAYFPNSTSGEILDNQCSDCKIPDDAPCPILLVQMTYNYDQVGNPQSEEIINCLVNDKGICQMKPILDKIQMVEDQQ